MKKFVTVENPESTAQLLTDGDDAVAMIITKNGVFWPVYETIEDAMADVLDEYADKVVPVEITVQRKVN